MLGMSRHIKQMLLDNHKPVILWRSVGYRVGKDEFWEALVSQHLRIRIFRTEVNANTNFDYNKSHQEEVR